jgi:hypothetical protein
MEGTNKKRKRPEIAIITVSIIWLGLHYYVSSHTDMFGAVLVGLPLLLFLGIGFLKYAIRAFRTRDLKSHVAVMLVTILGIPAAWTMVTTVSDQGLRTLNEERKRLFQELRPEFLRYRQEHGTFPEFLDELVSKYLNQIPPALVNDGSKDPYKKITYTGNEKDGIFQFHSIRGPDSSTWYSMAEDRYKYEE